MSKTANSSLVCWPARLGRNDRNELFPVCRFESCEASIDVFRSAGRPTHIRPGAKSGEPDVQKISSRFYRFVAP
jgi:hypothetical protein